MWSKKQIKRQNNIVLLRDVFHIGLVIGPRPAVLAWGAAECQYIRPRISYTAETYINNNCVWQGIWSHHIGGVVRC